MLTRFVRIQLAIFTIVGTLGVIAMVLFYIQAPTLLGNGRSVGRLGIGRRRSPDS
jgi:phospholipid/cholesterol/gamma-HCH transport system substrate-binding protein